MQSLPITPQTRSPDALPSAQPLAPRAAFVRCAALLAASLALFGCLDEDDPYWGSSNSGVDAGSGGQPGGNDAAPAPQDAGTVAPNDAGAVATDAATGLDAGSGSVDSGPDAASDASTTDAASATDAAIDGGDAGLADAASEGGLVDAASDGGSDGSLPPRPDLGKGDGSDVLMIGDSWMSLGGASSGIQGGILKASSQPYRANAIPGTTLLGGGILDILLAPITGQYEQAIQADSDVKTVIMTAGGNDILQTGLQQDCQMQGDACGEQVTKILDGLSKIWADMARDGVQDVVYILYATPEGTSVDFLLPNGDGAKQRCAAVPAPLRCHIVETLALVMGDIPDSIHPSQAASDRIGKAVVDLMAARGLRR